MNHRLIFLNKLMSLINNYFDAPYPATSEDELRISAEAKTAIWSHLATMMQARHIAVVERTEVDGSTPSPACREPALPAWWSIDCARTALPAQPSAPDLKPHLAWALRRISISLDIGDHFRAAQDALLDALNVSCRERPTSASADAAADGRKQ